jgi:hypothetical protein
MSTRIFIILILSLEVTLCQVKFEPEDEYLEYNAYWSFINLGKIRVWTKVNGDTVEAKVQLDSNPILFFISVHYTFESLFHIDSLLSARFLIYEEKDGRPVVTIFEKDGDRIRAEQRDVRTWDMIEYIEKYVGRDYYNGIAMFFLTRKLLKSRQKFTLPFLIELDVKDVEIDFTGKEARIEISSVNSYVKVVELNGFIPFIAKDIAGVTGEFTAWYSDDSARIPLKALFKTFLGNVRLELVRWRRDGWSPPVVLKTSN